MKKITRRFYFIVLGLVILIWPGVVRDASAQSISLDNVTVVRDSLLVQVIFSFEGLDGYDIDNDGLVVFISKYLEDLGEMKYMPYDTLYSDSDDFMIMIDNNEYYYLDVFSNHDDGPERYTLSLENFADSILTPFTPGHQTIFLHEAVSDQIDLCSGAITLNWGNYKMFIIDTGNDDEDERDAGFTHNRIMYLPPDGDTDSVAETLPFDSLTYDFVFNHGPGEYLIWVQAVEMVGGSILRTSNSNFISVPFDSPVLTNLEITKVDVINNSDIEVVFEAEGGQEGDLDEFTFEVYRADALDGDYILLEGNYTSIDMGAPFPLLGTYTFTDGNVPDIQAGPYYYCVVAHLVECEEEFLESSVISSLFLEGDIETYTEDNLIVVLEGAHYPEGMDYQLFRKLPWDDDWRPVGFSCYSLSFRDDLSMHIEDLAGEILYRLEASSGTDVIVSNVVSIHINVGLEVYNAFKPDSDRPDNRTFRPRLRGVTPTLFRLVIYNNWGQEIYSFAYQAESSVDWDGWNGTTMDGNAAPYGVYGYKIEYQIRNEKMVEKRGLVTLLR